MNNIEKNSILTIDDRFKILDLYFKKDNVMFRHHLDSYDLFIIKINELMTTSINLFSTKMVNKQKISQFLKFRNVRFMSPMNSNNQFITPADARINSLTYELRIIVDIAQYQEIYDLTTEKKFVRMVGNEYKEFEFTKIPLMVKSSYCNLHIGKEFADTECKYDGGGYFILGGTEKILVPFEELIDNKPLVFSRKESNIKYTIVQLNSKSPNHDEMRQIINIRMKSSDNITLRAPIFRDVSAFIIIRALGIESDKNIIDLIVKDKNDIEMINLLKTSLDNCRTDDTKLKIQTQKMAFEYLIKKVKVESNYTETNIELKKKQRIDHLKLLLKNKFIPHIPRNYYQKAVYVCYMIQKLLLVFLNRKPYDERDSYENKRIKMPGTILFEMFKKQFKILLSECGKLVDKNEIEPTNIIDRIKTSSVGSGIGSSMKKDEYGGRTGVCQILQRGSLLNTIALQTRIDAQIKNKQSSSKLLQTRYGHGTQLFLICFAQTPENDKAGLVKHLTMLTKLTLETNEQYRIIKDTILKSKYITPLGLIKIQDINSLVKVFMNGTWLGSIPYNKSFEFCNMMRSKKLNGEIDINTSIVYDIRSEYEYNEIHIWCDEGRLVTLMMSVENNKLSITKKKIIELEKMTKNNNNDTIETFIKLNPGLLEYVSADELHHSVVADNPTNIYLSREKQINSMKSVMKIKNPIVVRELTNRYSDLSYVKYTHCVIHPSIAMGVVVNNIPFPQCNQSPRVIYAYSQMRQGMCIYTTVYRNRLDISWVLYNPSRPIVGTRTMKYIHTDDMPFGENAIVAIMTYTGFNQEDSLIFNQSSIETGFMRSMSLTKYQSKQEKNQSTGKNDIFTKPVREKTIQFKPSNYSKLNELGYVPAETPVDNNDILIGKVSPLQERIDGKEYKDASVEYKFGEKGVVEKVWPNIVNSEGYQMIKMLIRSDRTPTVGDKFCSRSGQKGTIGAVYRQVDMPFTEDGMYPDIIMTPNAFPSRMTMSQLYELLSAKYGAAKGCTIDGTAYEQINIDNIKQKLRDMKLDDSGKETLVNGITGRTINKKITIGPTYYLRLKHMVNDKIHARAKGPLTSLTRQPLEGRAKDGGLRFGEMERDCMIAHGITRFLKEKTVEVSDKFYIYVCVTCGLFAQRQKKSSPADYRSTPNDVYICVKCNTKAIIKRTAMPYAFKLLIQEMMALGIESKLTVE